MKYEVVITARAKKYLEKIEEDIKNRINKALKNFIAYYNGEDVPVPQVTKLKGKYYGLLRLRIGDIRVIFKIERTSFMIFVIDIVPRGSAYKK